MILGALLDAGLDFELFQSELTKLNLPNCKLKQKGFKAEFKCNEI